jgi:hypothetical protein
MVVYWDHAMHYQEDLMNKKNLVITTIAAALLSWREHRLRQPPRG